MAGDMTTHLQPREGASPFRRGADAQETFDFPLLESLARVPSIAAVSITDRPSGTLVYVALRDMANEDTTYERLAEVRAYFGAIPLKLVCLPLTDFDQLQLSPTARLYSL